MTTFFLICAALGGGVLVVQLALGLLGVTDAGGNPHVGDGHDAGGANGAHAGLDLLSVRSISAGLAFFGLGGLAGLATGLGLIAAIPLSLMAGIAAMVGTAAVMRWMLRLEDDGTVSIHGAVGATGRVYLSIPGDRKGAGKVTLTLQNRTVEYQAVTSSAPLPTGAPIMVVDVIGPDTVDVVPDPTAKEPYDAVR
ncbi:MAG: hypothetical protein ACT4PJ_18075 [Gemmatimonadaceae bacterium]